MLDLKDRNSNQVNPGSQAQRNPAGGNLQVREQLRNLYREAAARAWSLEELQELRQLLQEPSFRLFHKALALAMAQVDDEMYRRDTTWDKYNYLRGRAQMIQELMRLPEQIDYDIEQMKANGD